MNRRRVVITGMGAITALGSSMDLYWDGLINGRSGVRRITQFDASDLPCQIAGEIPDFEPDQFMDRKEARRISRYGQVSLASAIQAVADAGLPGTMPDKERSGVVYGTSIGGADKLAEGAIMLRTLGQARVNPFVVGASIPNLGAFLIAREFQCLGPNCTVVTACATGTQAVGEAAEFVRRGAADIVITGGAEALICDFAIAGFCAMRALPVNFNDNPQAASRPFDARREGFLFSEGAAALVLEELEHAKARGARIYAEVAGYASSSDAFHVAQPDPEAKGPVRAMRWALADGGIQPNEVDYINAHGSSTPLNDSMETLAIKKLFGEHAHKLAISSTKSMVGHAMGASGALETIAVALAIHHGIIPPTINYEEPDPACDLDYVPNQARRQPVSVGLSNSFGLGGQNACIVLKRYQP